MATVTTTQAQLDPGTSTEVTLANTGSERAIVVHPSLRSPNGTQVLWPGQQLVVTPRGVAIQAYTPTGTTTVTASAYQDVIIDSDDEVTQAVQGLKGTYVRRPLPSEVWCIGDSISANGYTAPTSTNGLIYAGQSYLQWAGQLSQALIRVGGVAATGGYTTAQVLATHVPTVVAARPQACVVLAGTNDSVIGAQASKDNLILIWTALADAGVVPILATLTPRNDYSGASIDQITGFNAWISRQAHLRGFPLVDFYAATVDTSTGQWRTGYNADSVHQNTVGAKAMGQALADVATRLLNPNSLHVPPLPVSSRWPSLVTPWQDNALALTSGSGVPSNWGYDYGSGATTTVTAMSALEGIGNWFNMTRGAADFRYRPAVAITVVPGNRIAFGCRYKTSGMVANGASFSIRLTTTTTANQLWQWNAIAGVDVALGTIYEEITVPASIPVSTVKAQFGVDTGAGTLSVGQFLLQDLTAMAVV